MSGGAMHRDVSSWERFNRWYAQQARQAASRDALLRAYRYKPIRRTGPAPQWHPDAYQQPGEVE